MDCEHLLDSFLKFENEFSMFQAEVGGVKIWHYMRQRIFEDIVDQLDGYCELLTRNIQIKKTEHTWRDVFREKIICNQFFAHRRDVLIFPNIGKNSDGDGYYKCVYTDLLDKEMTRTHYLLDGKSSRGLYEKSRSKNILYSDLETFNKINKQKNNLKKISKSEIEKIVIIPIEKFLNIEISVSNKKKWLRIINLIVREREDYINYYNYMLQKIKPKVIIVSGAANWDKIILCEVSKKRNIPVIELQHGSIGKLHSAYNFLNKMNLPGFPDYIFTYGKLDKVRARFPIADERVIPVGFPELESYYKKYCTGKKCIEKRERKNILFISQHHSEMLEWVSAAARILDSEKYRIIYKLHPMEYGNWEKLYGGTLNNLNIEVVGDESTTIHKFLAEADWVVGYVSTALYEATMFKCKIAIIQASLSEDAEALYDNGYAILVESPQKLAEEIKEDTFEVNPRADLEIFEKNGIQNMLRSIDRIIEENCKK